VFDYIRFVIRNPSHVTKSARYRGSVRKAMRKHKDENPNCVWCGRSKKVEIHHIEPVSVSPEKAGDPNNLISLCRKPPCHQVIGHDGDFGRRYVENVKEVCDKNKTVSVGGRRIDDKQ